MFVNIKHINVCYCYLLAHQLQVVLLDKRQKGMSKCLLSEPKVMKSRNIQKTMKRNVCK